MTETAGVDDLQGLQPDFGRQNFDILFVHGEYLPFLLLLSANHPEQMEAQEHGLGQVASKRFAPFGTIGKLSTGIRHCLKRSQAPLIFYRKFLCFVNDSLLFNKVK